MIEKHYEVSCDNCGNTEHPPSRSIKGCINFCKETGWIMMSNTLTGTRHYCSKNCYEKKEK